MQNPREEAPRVGYYPCMKMNIFTLLLSLVLTVPLVAAGPKFQITLGPKAPKPTGPGRLVLSMAFGGEPRFTDTDPPGQPLFGIDVPKWPEGPVTLDPAAATLFPLTSWDKLPAGRYKAKVVFIQSADIMLPNAPGNLVSNGEVIDWNPARADSHAIELVDAFADNKPQDTEKVKFIQFPSKKLSAFHGRPMVYRAAVILPTNYAQEPNKTYPLVVHIGGFGTRYTSARRMPSDPRFLQVLLDGAGPYGDTYQVNSANNGPYGEALTEELIPHIEATYRGRGTPQSRFTTGGSTGGWVSLALQVFYPDFFNGCWSQCPDGVDFRAFELIDIYHDPNSYKNRYGFERPAKRTIDGDTIYTVRHEVQLERVLGYGNRWELSGRDWASWNATYGPRGTDGKPKPLWDGTTGVIDTSVLDHWKKYDLRRVMVENWATLEPKLRGKVNIWVGDADDYFLNNGVHRLREALKSVEPPFGGTILIEMRQPHTSGGWTREEMFDAMERRSRK
ncbi:MAG: alpha/beta hydrolase-fold protein [Gemmataceae bacterium]